ncbi:Hsp33 family molecular chaperone HslO [Pseudobacteroides cellulosolvens]|uniref:33 kDa chaperonin n=1 Tax=Pseudobacteroides cellulosolvens ATCC 35603 = DSM 2933 TaxID=398512 RepID=A0A0L6JNE7_9FIRM|nr:Hsp33 family molecular chaperone HslO [Pseudobacteroides cellulosolvens]KNY27341.1 33 kDa chaperonin [Pseudobacteroides cellulosolvens ATCC 35603 = DSM 2933]
MQDYIISGTAAEGKLRVFLANTTDMAREASTVHNLSAIASVALGRTLTAAALMSKTLKGEKDIITIQIKGSGPIGGIIVVTDSKSNVRGYAYNPQVDNIFTEDGKLDVGSVVGKPGYLNIIKDLGLKEPYVGYVNLVSGEIAEDLSCYFYYSEQIPTIVSLGVQVDSDESVKSSGGFFVQVMPDADEKIIDDLEERIKTIPAVSELLKNESPEDILSIILEGLDPKVTNKGQCKYQCNCSRERMEAGLISLGKDEITALINEQHDAELVCHFCNNKYQFTEQELKEIVERLK